MAAPPTLIPDEPSQPAQPPDGDVLILAGRAPTRGEEILAERFFERLADQSKQMDELARQMITVELAVPGLYASILALLRGQDATLPAGWPLVVTFACWLAALALSFLALFPRHYDVDPTILQGDPENAPGVMGLEAFYTRSAAYKRGLLLAAALLFWLGIIVAVWLLFA